MCYQRERIKNLYRFIVLYILGIFLVTGTIYFTGCAVTDNEEDPTLECVLGDESCASRSSIASRVLDLIVPSAHAEVAQATTVGYDVLGLDHKNFPCDEFIRQLPTGSALGYLAHTFSPEYNCLKKTLASGKVSIGRVHLLNNTCYRATPNRCGPYEVQSKATAGDIDRQFKTKSGAIYDAVVDRAKIVERIFKTANVPCLISPVLEHNLSIEAAKNAADLVRVHAPSCQPVNNPCNGCGHNVFLKGEINEAHGADQDRGANWIVSHDGESAENQNARKYLRRNADTKITFFWVSLYNIRVDGDFVDPRARTKKPSAGELKSIFKLVEDRSERVETPNFQCNFIPLKTTDPKNIILWKSHAEDKGNNDPRANKPLFIVREKANFVTALNSNGQEVGKLTYYGTYENAHRYYSGHRGGANLFGFQFSRIAKTQTDNSTLWLKVNENCYGPFIGTYRKGYFQK